jgi:hypothetical protein
MSSMKYEPVDTEYVDKELEKFFRSIDGKKLNERLYKYKKRFFNEENQIISFENKRRTERLSLGKKLEILCCYANHKITKDRK